MLGGDTEEPSGQQAWVARFDPSGALIWSDAFGTRDDTGTAVAAAPGGATLLVWATRTDAEREIRLRRYGAQGEAEWSERVALSGDSLALAVACDGSALLTSSIVREPRPDAPWDNRMTLAIARHGSDGVATWQLEEELPAPYTYGSGHAIAVTRTGDAFVLGSYLDASGSTYAPWIGGVVQ